MLEARCEGVAYMEGSTPPFHSSRAVPHASRSTMSLARHLSPLSHFSRRGSPRIASRHKRGGMRCLETVEHDWRLAGMSSEAANRVTDEHGRGEADRVTTLPTLVNPSTQLLSRVPSASQRFESSPGGPARRQCVTERAVPRGEGPLAVSRLPTVSEQLPADRQDFPDRSRCPVQGCMKATVPAGPAAGTVLNPYQHW